jgi:hypothetical protein
VGIELRRFVEATLRVTHGAEDLTVADNLAAQAVGDRLQKGVAVADLQGASGTEDLVKLIIGEMQNGHCE